MLKELYDRPNANLRPLHNSNVAKVTIVKWSQILMITDRSYVSGLVCFHQLGPLGRVGLVVAMSVCLSVCLFDVPFPCNFFQGLSLAFRTHDQIPASHWPCYTGSVKNA